MSHDNGLMARTPLLAPIPLAPRTPYLSSNHAGLSHASRPIHKPALPPGEPPSTPHLDHLSESLMMSYATISPGKPSPRAPAPAPGLGSGPLHLLCCFPSNTYHPGVWLSVSSPLTAPCNPQEREGCLFGLSLLVFGI